MTARRIPIRGETISTDSKHLSTHSSAVLEACGQAHYRASHGVLDQFPQSSTCRDASYDFEGQLDAYPYANRQEVLEKT